MRRSEAALLVLTIFMAAWILIWVAHPLVGLAIVCGVFAVFLGFFIFIVAGIVYMKRK